MGGQIAFLGIANKGEQNQKWLPVGGPKEGGNATSPLHSRGSPKWGNKIRSGCLTPTFSGGPKEGGSATSPLRSRGSPAKGTETKVAHKRAELLRRPYVLGGTQTRGQSQRWPTSGRKCYVTATFSRVPEKGFKSGPCRAPGKNPIVGVLRGGPYQKKIGPKGPPCLSRSVEKSPSEQGTRSEVANKWPESSKP